MVYETPDLLSNSGFLVIASLLGEGYPHVLQFPPRPHEGIGLTRTIQ